MGSGVVIGGSASRDPKNEAPKTSTSAAGSAGNHRTKGTTKSSADREVTTRQMNESKLIDQYTGSTDLKMNREKASSSALLETTIAMRQVKKETTKTAETAREAMRSAVAVQATSCYKDNHQGCADDDGDGDGDYSKSKDRVFSATAGGLTPIANQNYGDVQSSGARWGDFSRTRMSNAPGMFGDTSIYDILQQLPLQHQKPGKHQQQEQREETSTSTSSAFYDDLEGEIKSLQSRIMGRLGGNATAVTTAPVHDTKHKHGTK